MYKPEFFQNINAESLISTSCESIGNINYETKSNNNANDNNIGLKDKKTNKTDVICLSHLRWNFVFQRPQHLLTRFAAAGRVFYIEEPIWEESQKEAFLEVNNVENNIWIIVPHLPDGLPNEAINQHLAGFIAQILADFNLENYISWYYTPMAFGFSHAVLSPKAIVYDCMDELSAFSGASLELKHYEKQLLERADIVFTGGQSLYEAKKDQHTNVHACPSSIDYDFFAQARNPQPDPQDQADIAHPRIGFFGVIDERLDINLVAELAVLCPDKQFVFIGPVVKIDPATMPRYANIHYLGMKNYKELPAYLAGWDVAFLPFALNESTKFISPTKTPEYLAGGRTVVSTPIQDVIRPYGEQNLVHIAHDARSCALAIDNALAQRNDADWIARTDEFLAQNSWQKTYDKMNNLIHQTIEAKVNLV